MSHETYAETRANIDEAREAFGHLWPIRDDYALVPIEQGFNWEECAFGITVPTLYLVVFRSIRREDADIERLRWFDDRAYEDATQAPGFLFYFKGQVTPDRHCLSFCLWKSRDEARAASNRPPHAAAASLVSEMYETYDLERHRVHQHDGSLVFRRLPG